jgi:hypothetical protein
VAEDAAEVLASETICGSTEEVVNPVPSEEPEAVEVEAVEVEVGSLTASRSTENGSLGAGSPDDETGPSSANWAWSWATTGGT